MHTAFQEVQDSLANWLIFLRSYGNGFCVTWNCPVICECMCQPYRLVKISMISTKPVHFKDKKKNGAKLFGMISITTHKNAPRIAVGELQL